MDFSGSGSLETRDLNGPSGQLVDAVLMRESAAGVVAWYLPDRLGAVRDLVSNAGAIIDHVDYSAFGTVLGETAPSVGDRMMGFAGLVRVSVTGLNPAVMRAQDPGTGRWTSQDPIGFAGGDANLYRYVGNGPNGLADRSGLEKDLTPAQLKYMQELLALIEKIISESYPGFGPNAGDFARLKTVRPRRIKESCDPNSISAYTSLQIWNLFSVMKMLLSSQLFGWDGYVNTTENDYRVLLDDFFARGGQGADQDYPPRVLPLRDGLLLSR